MTHDEFIAKVQEFGRLVDKHRQAISKLKAEEQQLKDEYVKECFERSGYKVGQKVYGERGRVFFVSGAHECCRSVHLSLNPANKDGTMSKVVFIGRGEPRIVIG